MGRKGKPVSVETINTILELGRTRCTNIEIQRKTGVDRRKVAKIISDDQKEIRLREIGSARRDVAAEFLKEHINDIESASFYLLGITLPDYWVRDLDDLPVNIEEKLITYLRSDSFKPGELKTMGLPKGAFTGIPKTDPFRIAQMVNTILADKYAKELVTSLKEHLPALWSVVKLWEKYAMEYNLKSKEVLPQLREYAVELKMNQKSVNAGIAAAISLVSHENPDNDEEPLPQNTSSTDTPEGVVQNLIQNKQTGQQLKTLRPYLLELNDTYEKIAAMLSRSKLNKDLIEGHCRYCPVP